ncbi:MAG TPA: hypothetical protein VM305_00630 [Candidatus Limnocylindrales bacterium]|nr:hypothetical protein [Candidatus Limnocylindrales bacterium]
MGRLPRTLVALPLALLFAIAAAGCGGADASPPPEPTPGQVPSPVPEPEMPHGFVEAILADAAQVTGRPQEEHRVERADPATFTDESLNCPTDLATGATPPAATEPVDGYNAIVLLEDVESGLQQRLDYRIRAEDGSFIRCETLPDDQLPSPISTPVATPEA